MSASTVKGISVEILISTPHIYLCCIYHGENKGCLTASPLYCLGKCFSISI